MDTNTACTEKEAEEIVQRIRETAERKLYVLVERQTLRKIQPILVYNSYTVSDPTKKYALVLVTGSPTYTEEIRKEIEKAASNKTDTSTLRKEGQG